MRYVVEFGAVDAVNLGCVLLVIEDRWEMKLPAFSQRIQMQFAHICIVWHCPVQCACKLFTEHLLLFEEHHSDCFPSNIVSEIGEEAIFLPLHYLFVSDKEREILVQHVANKESDFHSNSNYAKLLLIHLSWKILLAIQIT